MADIPGLIEGASEGVGLGYDFLRHIERTKVLVHVVDAASTEGRDPVEDIKTIMNELKGYDESLLDRPQVIAANKIDAIYDEENDNIKRIREAFPDIKVFPISGVSGKGIPELLYELVNILSTIDRTPTVFEKEFEIDYSSDKNLPFTVEIDEDGVFVVEGPRIEKMLGYTNLDSEKGFDFFQKFLKTSGVLEKLEEAGIEDGNTVRMYGHEFDYYK
jgi:obg family GTPase cgtA, C-terminal extension